MANKKIEIDYETAKGLYSTVVFMTHCEEEFILDFGTMLPEMECPLILSRIILSPKHAKRLLSALKDNIGKYENAYGAINSKEAKDEGAFTLNPFGPNKNKS